MNVLCRLDMHKWSVEGGFVQDNSLVKATGFITVIEAGYYRYYCVRCMKANDADYYSKRKNDAQGR